MTRGRKSDIKGAPIDELLELVKQKQNLKLCKDVFEYVGLNAPVVSRMRHGLRQPTAETILRLYDATGLSVAEIRGKFGIKSYLDLFQQNAKQAGDKQPAQN